MQLLLPHNKWKLMLGWYINYECFQLQITENSSNICLTHKNICLVIRKLEVEDPRVGLVAQRCYEGPSLFHLQDLSSFDLLPHCQKMAATGPNTKFLHDSVCSKQERRGDGKKMDFSPCDPAILSKVKIFHGSPSVFPFIG